MVYPWGHQRRFNSYAQYFKKIYGKRVQKLTIDAGFNCPNRDGTISTGGCHYCNNDAFNPSYCNPSKTITEQLSEGVEFHQIRYRRATNYLAYFQAYSNTYAPIEELKNKYQQALNFPGVIGLVIGTRPDCINQAILDYLAKLSQSYYIIIEYGIESCNDKVLTNLNRGHDFQTSLNALYETKKRNIKTGAHFIIGLPGETPEGFIDNLPVISSLPLDTIKFHQFQITTATHYADLYRSSSGSFNLLELEQYIDIMVQVTERLNPSIVIERIASEVPPRYLIAPNWGLIRNHQIIAKFENALEQKNTWQGKLIDSELKML